MNILSLPDQWLLGVAIVVVFSMLSFWSKKIDGLGAAGGGVIALSIFLGGGFVSLGLLFVFFVLGSAASSWKMNQKIEMGLAEKNKGKRTIVNALSNGGVAALCGLCAFLFPEFHIVFVAMLAASLAAATSDTLSSELGNIYGSSYIDILTLKSGERGKDGVVSMEGTLIGLVGSGVIAMCYVLGGLKGGWGVFFAGFLGNVLDSILGASLQRRGGLSNHGVNAVNTLFAACCQFLFMSI